MNAHRNWAGNVTFRARTIHRPQSLEQLQELVAASRALRALGTGHSFSPVADTTGDQVVLDALGLGAEIDAPAGSVVAPAGIRFAELTELLADHGRALPNLGSLPHISIAGAVATGTHGSGSANPCLAAGVEAVEFVRADGELITLSRGVRPESLPGAVVALGALGIVTRLWLRTVPAFDLRQDVYLDLPTATLLARADEVLDAGYSVSVFTDWSRPDVIDQVWLKRTPDADAPPHWLGARLADRPQHPVRGQDPATATQQLGVAGPSHQRLPHFRPEFRPSTGAEIQSEYLLPRSAAGPVLGELRRLAGRIAPALQVCEIRTVAADDLWLSPAYGRDSVAVHFTWKADPDALGAVLAVVEAVLLPFDPRPHWGKVFTLDPGAVRTAHPRRSDFVGLVDEHDPERKFGNDFLTRYVY